MLLILKLHKGDAQDLDVTDFVETIEALEDLDQVLLLDVLGDVLNKERLVRTHMLIRNGGCSSLG